MMMRSSCTFVREPTTADVGTCADTVREEEIVAIHSLDLLWGRRGNHGQLRRNLGREQAVNVFRIEKTNTKLQHSKHKHKQQQQQQHQ